MEAAETIFNNYFFLVYLVLVFIVSIVAIEVYVKKNTIYKTQNFLVVAFLIIFILMFGFRNYEVGVDTVMYLSIYNLGNLEYNEKGFSLYNSLFYNFGATDRIYIFSIAFNYLLLIYVFLKRKQYKNIFLIFFCWVSLFFFKSMGINTIRQGLASYVFLVGLTFKKPYIKYIFFIIASSIHVSLALVFVAYIGTKFLTNKMYAIVFFTIGVIFSIINVPIYSWLSAVPGINMLVKDKFEFYNSVDTGDYKIGFRPDFFIFNLFFAIVGYYVVNNLKNLKEYKNYNQIFNIYLYLSAFFFIMFNSGYSDRYGFLSWMFIPIIIAPFFELDKFKSVLLNKFTILLICFIFGIIFYKIKSEF